MNQKKPRHPLRFFVGFFLVACIWSCSSQDNFEDDLEFPETARLIETYLALPGFPYTAPVALVELQKKLRATRIRLYDDSYRVLTPEKDSKEIFHKFLRFTARPIPPGKFRIFQASRSSREIFYRMENGAFFLIFEAKLKEKPHSDWSYDLAEIYRYPWLWTLGLVFFFFPSFLKLSFRLRLGFLALGLGFLALIVVEWSLYSHRLWNPPETNLFFGLSSLILALGWGIPVTRFSVWNRFLSPKISNHQTQALSQTAEENKPEEKEVLATSKLPELPPVETVDLNSIPLPEQAQRKSLDILEPPEYVLEDMSDWDVMTIPVLDEPLVSFIDAESVYSPSLRTFLPPCRLKPKTIQSVAEETIDPEIEKKRSSIFNKDLKSIVDRVLQKDTYNPVAETPAQNSISDHKSKTLQDSLLEPKPLETSIVPALSKPEVVQETVFPAVSSPLFRPNQNLDVFTELYRTPNLSLESVHQVAKSVMNSIGIKIFSYLILEPGIGAYSSMFSEGLDIETHKNLYFSNPDSYLPIDETIYSEFPITEEWRNDIFFTKRFSIHCLNYFDRLAVVNLSAFGTKAFFLIFLSKTDQIEENDVFSKLEEIGLLVPAVASLTTRRKTLRFFSRNQVEEQRNSFLRLTNGGKDSCVVYKLLFAVNGGGSLGYYIKKDVLATLKEKMPQGTAILETSPDCILLFVPPKDGDFVDEILGTFSQDFDLKKRFYPQDGVNFYTYL